MKELRKRQFYPDVSFDLTGDGSVSIKELQIAKKFDQNKNGLLEEEERQKCIEALKGGLETKQRFRDESPLVQQLRQKQNYTDEK